MEDFIQQGPVLTNTYLSDELAQSYLRRKLPKALFEKLHADLTRLGERASKEILTLGKEAEANLPKHIPYGAWGERLDAIEVSRAWQDLARIATEERLVHTAYAREEGEHSRIHQMMRIYLYGPSAALYTCPLAMTDGAARAIEVYGAQDFQKAFEAITSKDPKHFWTSGQWMTEKSGGSDVSQASTIAKKEGDHFRLFGTKWFTSAITSDMAMTLARIEGAPEGSRGLSLFYLELRDEKNQLNHISILRLKDKMGTKALPTAELSLNGTKAWLVGGEGHGIKKIASLFNITRVWNACTAASFMRRGLMLSKDYSKKRSAFGAYLKDHPLHVETLAQLEVEARAAFLLVMRVAELLGKDECKKATEDESKILRILTPLAKLYTAKQSIQVASEVIESVGGAAYMEDTGFPALLRDSQVLSIWEGTTNVLSLDVLRSIHKENSLEPMLADIKSILSRLAHPALLLLVPKLNAYISESVEHIDGKPASDLAMNARCISYRFAKMYMAALLLEHADWSKTSKDTTAAQRWIQSLELGAKDFKSEDDAKLSMDLVFESK